MTDGMAWQNPPLGTRYDWAAITPQLRAHPNEWLLVFEDGPISVVNALRQNDITAVTPVRRRNQAPSAGYEVMTRNNRRVGEARTADLYLRWYDPELEE